MTLPVSDLAECTGCGRLIPIDVFMAHADACEREESQCERERSFSAQEVRAAVRRAGARIFANSSIVTQQEFITEFERELGL